VRGTHHNVTNTLPSIVASIDVLTRTGCPEFGGKYSEYIVKNRRRIW
jgi:hypothetical protein